MERYSNLAVTTLAANINSVSTALTVTSATKFPTSGTFRIIVENEIMAVTAVSGSVFTVVRGSEGTTAASHTSGVSCALILTKSSIEALRVDQSIVVDEYSIPEFPAGQLNFGTGSLSRLDPVNLRVPYGPTIKCNPPVGGWSWVNQGVNATQTLYGPGYLTTVLPNGQASTARRSNLIKAAVGTTVDVVMSYVHANATTNAFSGFGLVSPAGLLAGFAFNQTYLSGRLAFTTRLFTDNLSTTAAPTNTVTARMAYGSSLIYARLNIGGGFATASLSLNGVHYSVRSTLSTANFTSANVALFSTSATGSTAAVNQTTYYSVRVY